MKYLHYISYTLLWIGGLNWGSIGLLKLNLVEKIVGAGTPSAKLIYLLVGSATLFTLATHKITCNVCTEEMRGGSEDEEEDEE